MTKRERYVLVRGIVRLVVWVGIACAIVYGLQLFMVVAWALLGR